VTAGARAPRAAGGALPGPLATIEDPLSHLLFLPYRAKPGDMVDIVTMLTRTELLSSRACCSGYSDHKPIAAQVLTKGEFAGVIAPMRYQRARKTNCCLFDVCLESGGRGSALRPRVRLVANTRPTGQMQAAQALHYGPCAAVIVPRPWLLRQKINNTKARG
jgi:hypothetical protein